MARGHRNDDALADMLDDGAFLIGDVVPVVGVVRRRRPVRLLLLLGFVGLLGWMISRYVASRKRRAIEPTTVAGPPEAVPPPAEARDGEAAPEPAAPSKEGAEGGEA
jgi:hypothetical protein